MVRRVTVGVLLVGLLLSMGVPAVVSGGDELGFSSVAAVEPAADGGWWVLERSLQGHGGIVYRYNDSWGRTDERYRIELGAEHTSSPTDFARAEDGGWWIAGREGRVYRFASNWTATDESYVLEHPNYEWNLTSVFGLTSAEGGGWWVAGGHDLFRYTDDWTFDDSGIAGAVTAGSGYPFASAHGFGNSLWVLDGGTGTGLSGYPLDEGGGRIDPDSTSPAGNDANGPPMASPAAGYSVPDIVDIPVDVVRADGGWWVVDGDGQIHRFDRYWRYTGISRPVGSGDAVGSYPSDVVSPLVVLVPLVGGLIWLFPGLLVAVGTAWEFRTESRNSALVGGIGVAAAVYGVAWEPFTLRPAVFAELRLPLVVALATLLLPAYHVYRRFAAGERIASLVVMYVPAVLAGWWMLGPALRAW